VQGQNLAAPQAVVAHTTARRRLAVAWDGGSTRDLEVVTGTGHWSRLGADWVDVRGVDVPEGTGTHRDAYVLTTDRTLPPPQRVAGYPQRWAMATTFQACRASVTRESTQG
jgi:hypothetical protein